MVYRLAQILDNHARVLPNADGVHIQWCNLSTASEKVIFKSMQEVFKHAQHFIENKKQRYQSRRHDHDHHHHHHRVDGRLNNNAGSQRNILQSRGSLAPQRRSLQQQQQHQTTTTMSTTTAESTTSSNTSNHHHQATDNPWYKTRLCERFETEGSCSYGSKCTFAHGVAELRERTGAEEDPVAKSGATTNDKNPLYKTKLCERFMKDNFCQYGPKCHFGKCAIRTHGGNGLTQHHPSFM